MPNFDTGHLFLTFLTPIKKGTTKDMFGAEVSFEQQVRTVLGLLPTALQSPATQEIGLNSPFSRTVQTHLCRFLVIEDVIYNGRTPSDALIGSLKNEDPINPQPVDKLNAAYLLFVADIDAVMEVGDPLPASLTEAEQDAVRDAYAKRLWDSMDQELRSIYNSCLDFEGVETGEDFARYMARCQVETTMPFNDYWIAPPTLPELKIKPIAAAVLAPLALSLIGLVFQLFGADDIPILGWSPGWTFLIFGLVTAGAAYWAVRKIMTVGQGPMSPAQYGDLPSVLKSLYLQQNFSDFAVDAQGKDAETLHADFGAFLETHSPETTAAPTQHPGVVSIKEKDAVVT